MHVGMVTINTEKMSKSLGNIVPIKDAVQKWGPNTIRLFCLSVRYTKPLDYQDLLLKEAAQKWKQIEVCVWELENWRGGSSKSKDNTLELCTQVEKLFDRAMENNLDTPVGPGSTIAAVAIVNSIKVRVAELLTERGAMPPVITRASEVGAERSRKLFDQAYREHARRIAGAIDQGGGG